MERASSVTVSLSEQKSSKSFPNGLFFQIAFLLCEGLML